jgi:alpha-1,2-mannosyltransferase
MQLDFFTQARWLNEARITAYSRLFLAIYVVAIVALLAVSPHLIDPNGKPVGTDFMNVWAAGKLVLGGRPAAVYDYAQHFAVQRQALPWSAGQDVPYFAWHYPPMFLFVAAGLALLPYGLALALWMLCTLPLYLAAIGEIIPGLRARIVALAFPGVFVNLGHGQNGFLTTGLLGGGLVLLQSRPAVAGALLGLLAYKPQFALLVPLALFAGDHWRALAAASATVLAIAAISWAGFGSDTWYAFFASLKMTQNYVLEQGVFGWPKFQSAFGAVRLLGGGIAAAYAVQALVALMASAALVWVWRRRSTTLALKGATLALATLLATPYVLDYDLMLLALPIAWLAAVGLRQGFLAWEKTALLALWLLPLLSRMVGQSLDLPVAPVMLVWLLLLTLRRVTHSPKAPSIAEKNFTAAPGPG